MGRTIGSYEAAAEDARIRASQPGRYQQPVTTYKKTAPCDGGVCICSLQKSNIGKGDCPWCIRYILRVARKQTMRRLTAQMKRRCESGAIDIDLTNIDERPVCLSRTKRQGLSLPKLL